MLVSLYVLSGVMHRAFAVVDMHVQQPGLLAKKGKSERVRHLAVDFWHSEMGLESNYRHVAEIQRQLIMYIILGTSKWELWKR